MLFIINVSMTLLINDGFLIYPLVGSHVTLAVKVNKSTVQVANLNNPSLISVHIC